jgi:hypothetical protein
MLADGADLHLSRSQIETMLHAVVEKQLAKLERVALASKNAPDFVADRAKNDDLRALWSYTLLDAQGMVLLCIPRIPTAWSPKAFRMLISMP